MLGWVWRLLKALPWVALLVVMAKACGTSGERAGVAASTAKPAAVSVR